MTVAPPSQSQRTGSDAWSDTKLLYALEEVVERELNRHLKAAKEWMPHEYVPWSDGRNFDGIMGGEAWSPEQSKVSDIGRIALVVNLLTEDNLPSYHHEIATLFGRDGAWGTWVHRWTAEEGRHAIAMRDYLLTTRAVDPVELERFRMQHMSEGFESDNAHSMLHTVAYVAFQELATRVSHRNTGHESGDPACDRMLARIATDENLHMVFYRGIGGAALDLTPNQMMRALTDVVLNFQMPGLTQSNFRRNAVLLAKNGIYDPRQHLDGVLRPVLRTWNVFGRTDLSDDGARARDELHSYLEDLEIKARRFEEQRDRALARAAVARAV
ncbi:acyl-ACP desaturase [Actinacidiphila oryziradicis]|uniref:acyl-ACP desaturase n=1 Tax=Actinacidiphila oryziradicis TaxID=2571141 RepID=UPI0023F1D87D|nr:acyl-ACP desaturase [Actinacidiphila oryziradicis]MCW2869128.1 acyl-ACP desaturase [Actinacidiphila oryziradicis]